MEKSLYYNAPGHSAKIFCKQKNFYVTKCCTNHTQRLQILHPMCHLESL